MSYQDDSEKLYKSLFKTKESDKREREIIDLIKNTNLEQRLHIRKYYDTVFTKKNLIEDLDSQLSGSFCKLTKYLFMEPLDYDCLEIFNALDSIRYDKKNIFEIITARPYDYIQKLKVKYSQIYKEGLEKLLTDKFGNEIGIGILSIMNTKRDTNPNPNKNEATIKANNLIKVKPNDWLKEMTIFNGIFAKSSPQELIMIGRIFYETTKSDLPTVITKELSSDKSKFLTEVLYNACHPSELYAIKLHDAIKGLGTDNNTINRIFVTRHELDMNIIRVLYKYYYDVELSEDIIDDTSGNYQTLLLELMKKKI